MHRICNTVNFTLTGQKSLQSVTVCSERLTNKLKQGLSIWTTAFQIQQCVPQLSLHLSVFWSVLLNRQQSVSVLLVSPFSPVCLCAPMQAWPPELSRQTRPLVREAVQMPSHGKNQNVASGLCNCLRVQACVWKNSMFSALLLDAGGVYIFLINWVFGS